MREVAVAGVGLTKFDRYDGRKGRPFKNFDELGEEAILAALDYAGFEWRDIEAVFGAHAFQGASATNHCLNRIGLTGIPVVNVENGCASSQSAFRLAYQQVACGLYDVILVVGFEKVPTGLIDNPTVPKWQREMGLDVMAALSGCSVQKYMEDYDAVPEDFARVAVMERRNANKNPKAFFYQKGEPTVEEILASPTITSPLTTLMMCPNGDGASAAIVCTPEKLKSRKNMVTVAASVQSSGLYGNPQELQYLRHKNPSVFERGGQMAYEAAGIGPEDLSVVQVHDPYTPVFFNCVEDLKLCERGEGPALMREGYFDINGTTPVGTDGGTLGRSHPVGATGIAEIAELFYQLRGECGPRQVANAKVGLAHNAGPGPTCIVTVLKK
ncbi:thiolase family protein [Pseudomaricurvus alkylphenolicus]|jgi:acetyl-CoA acetyltransferase|uniref:thiolase family protein n=1 Tax=Pseudomaricurvus alkylphenolicus TaxID=1306991 RepID=UPI00141EA15C|nr:thiolase family protein [Pseudomaricurvus alkylphenolicus]NIB37967.1 thiolase family protein [Pseudomaricurvus alkylphenolicus]